jgi:type IV pilus assembly protein PilB
MIIDKELRRLIHAGESSDALRDAAQKNGMKMLWNDGVEKVLKGITSVDELKRVTFSDGDQKL